MVLPRQRKRLGPSHRDQNLESLVARQIAQNARIVRIVFDDQQHRIAFLQIVAIVLDTGFLFHRLTVAMKTGLAVGEPLFSVLATFAHRRADIRLRQVKGECAALAGHALS